MLNGSFFLPFFFCSGNGTVSVYCLPGCVCVTDDVGSVSDGTAADGTTHPSGNRVSHDMCTLRIDIRCIPVYIRSH